MNKLLLAAIALCVFYLSNTPHLKVSQPSSWLNPPAYKKDVTLKSVLQKGSDFYKPYSRMGEKEFLLHKLGHAVFYSAIGFFLRRETGRRKRGFFIAFAALACFAFADEIHQSFVAGRDGRALDVALDVCCGAIFAARFRKKSRAEEA